MVHDSVDVSPFFRIGNKHEREEIPGLGGDIVGERRGSDDNILVEQVDIVLVVIKGEIAGEHSVQDNAATPNIHGRSNVPHQKSPARERRNTVTHNLSASVRPPCARTGGETKVCDDDIRVSIKEEDFELWVLMKDLLLMNVPDA